MNPLELHRDLRPAEAVFLGAFVFFLLSGLFFPPAGSALLLLVLVSGPLSVGLYLVGLLLGRFSADGLPQLVVGSLFSLLWLGCLFVMVLDIFVGSLPGILMLILDLLALAAGLIALDRGWPSEDQSGRPSRWHRPR